MTECDDHHQKKQLFTVNIIWSTVNNIAIAVGTSANLNRQVQELKIESVCCGFWEVYIYTVKIPGSHG